MKKNLLAVMMLAGIFLATSCTPESVEEPTLQLSETGTVALPKSASEKAITVTTNQTEWTSTANVDWVQLIQSGKTLTVKTGENFTCDKRKAEVTVIAGGIGKKLAIEQSESELTVVTFPDKLEVNQWGGNFQFDVNANSDDWAISSNAEWLKVTPKQFKKEVVLEIEENTARENRTAVLTISGGGKANLKEFTVTQSGILYYLLPYLQVETSFGIIKEFEDARRSTYIPDFGSVLYDEHSFHTKSPAFPSIIYTNANNSTSNVVMIASSADFIKDPEFEAMMTENGYDHPSEELYTKKVTQGESKYIIEAEIVEDDQSGIVFTFTPEQSGPMPTFDKFPYSFRDIGAPDGTLENVRAWENANGGVYNTDESVPSNGFHWFDAPSPWIIRAYIFEDKPHLLQTLNIFTDIPKFYFKAGGKYIMTEEFKALKDKEGFTDYLGSSKSGLDFYGSPGNPYGLAIGVVKYTNVLEGKQEIVDLRLHLAEEPDESGVLRDPQRERKLNDIGPKSLSFKAIRLEK